MTTQCDDMDIQRRRKSWKIVISVLLLGAVLVGWFIVALILDRQELEIALRRIEAEYGPTLELIETRAKELPTDRDPRPESFDRREAIEAEIKGRLFAPDIVSASWSLDGHHGMSSLRNMTVSGYSYPLWGPSVRTGSRTLRFGRAFDGRRLYVLQGRIPEGVKRVYQIVFLVES